MEFLFFTEPSVAIFIIRVVLGIIFFAHGAQKVLGWYGGQGLKGTAAFFNSMGMPLPIAYLVCLLEFLSGIGLLIGLRPGCCGNHGGCRSNGPFAARLFPQRRIKAGEGQWDRVQSRAHRHGLGGIDRGRRGIFN